MTVLIADDEDLARYTIKTLISRNHPELEVIAEASNGDDAVSRARELGPDIALLDIRMPGRNGLDAARAIRENRPETRIVILTAYEDFSVAQQAVNLGIAGYLLKPVSADAFAERISAISEHVNGSDTRERKGKNRPQTEESVSWRLKRALRYIQDNLHRDLPMNDVATEAGISAHHLSRLFKEELHTGFVRYVTDLRMSRACRLLEESVLGIAEIADQCGFTDANYFAKVFRKSLGVSPGDYRNGFRPAPE